jgi:hypothetical protein
MEGFELDVLGKILLHEVVDARVRAKVEVTWMEKGGKILGQGQ